MVVFDNPDKARNYADDQEKLGLKCTIATDIFGNYTVSCGFPKQPKPVGRVEGKPVETYTPAAPQPISRKLVEFAEEFTPESRAKIREQVREIGRPKRIETQPMTGSYGYQQEAVNAAMTHNDVIISLPTGRGKTNVGLEIVNKFREPTLIIVPTIVLLGQWKDEIVKGGGEVGIVGGGSDQWLPLTLITYQSAVLHLDRLREYKIFIFDEVHHAFAPEFRRILTTASEIEGQHMIGLTASIPTYEEAKNLMRRYFPEQFTITISEFQESKEHKIELRVKTIRVDLSSEEFEQYEYFSNVVKNAIRKYGEMRNWQYIMRTGTPDARKGVGAGFKAYNARKKMLAEMPEKIDEAARIIEQHSGTFVIFTDTIAMADTVYERLMSLGIPSIVIHSKRGLSMQQRTNLLNDLRSGKARVLIGVSSIEEGVNVPDLDSAIFLSSSTTGERKYIQRAGRVLRPVAGKVATIYIVFAHGTVEENNLQRIYDMLGL